MLVTVPLLALVSLVVWAMWKHGAFVIGGNRLTASEFIVCALWGFLLAQSSFAGPVQHVINAFTGKG